MGDTTPRPVTTTRRPCPDDGDATSRRADFIGSPAPIASFSVSFPCTSIAPAWPSFYSAPPAGTPVSRYPRARARQVATPYSGRSSWRRGGTAEGAAAWRLSGQGLQEVLERLALVRQFGGVPVEVGSAGDALRRLVVMGTVRDIGRARSVCVEPLELT